MFVSPPISTLLPLLVISFSACVILCVLVFLRTLFCGCWFECTYSCVPLLFFCRWILCFGAYECLGVNIHVLFRDAVLVMGFSLVYIHVSYCYVGALGGFFCEVSYVVRACTHQYPVFLAVLVDVCTHLRRHMWPVGFCSPCATHLCCPLILRLVFLQPRMAFVFELFRLKGASNPVDEVVAWGAFPVSAGDFSVVEVRSVFQCAGVLVDVRALVEKVEYVFIIKWIGDTSPLDGAGSLQTGNAAWRGRLVPRQVVFLAFSVQSPIRRLACQPLFWYSHTNHLSHSSPLLHPIFVCAGLSSIYSPMAFVYPCCAGLHRGRSPPQVRPPAEGIRG